MTTPLVSVILPTYRRPAALARTVQSLATQDYARDRVEVIVVDDGGDASLAHLAATHPRLVTLVRTSHGGPASARNFGVAVAKGEVFAFIDDDCIADRTWIAQLVAALDAHPDAVIGGQVASGATASNYARASQTLLTFLYQYYHEERQGHLPFFTTNNLAVRAEVFAAIGAFDSSFPFASEDREWCDRCAERGHPLVYAPSAVVHHDAELSFTGFARQHFRYGEGAWRFHRVRARRHGAGMRVEPARFYHGMLRAPFRFGDPQPIRQSLLLLASQGIAALGYASAALRNGRHS